MNFLYLQIYTFLWLEFFIRIYFDRSGMSFVVYFNNFISKNAEILNFVFIPSNDVIFSRSWITSRGGCNIIFQDDDYYFGSFTGLIR